MLLIVGCGNSDKSPISLTENDNQITISNRDMKFVLDKNLLIDQGLAIKTTSPDCRVGI